jgi:hypothetical protein
MIFTVQYFSDDDEVCFYDIGSSDAYHAPPSGSRESVRVGLGKCAIEAWPHHFLMQMCGTQYADKCC